jgi:NADH-quinone oxidoreductase subunit J
VYVGAVMVLFLFVVMMLDVNFDNLRKQIRSYIPVGATVGALVLVEMALTLLGGRMGAGPARPTRREARATRRRWGRSSIPSTSIRSRSRP